MASPQPGGPYQAPGVQIPAHWQSPDEEPPYIKWWQKVLMVLGAIFLVLLVVGGIAGIAGYGYSKGLDRESKEYADNVIPLIFTDWNVAAMKSHISPEFQATLKGDDLERLFAHLQRLGKMKKYPGANGQAGVNFTPQQGRVTNAQYVARVEYERGKAEIILTLIKHQGQWQILGFRVNSPELLNR